MNNNNMLWKVFLFIWVILAISTLLSEFSEEGMIGFSELFNFALGIVGAIGLYGFIYNRKYFTLKFWKIFLNLQLAFIILVTISVILMPADNSPPIMNMKVILFLLIFGPYFYGLYLYSYKSQRLWESPNKAN